MAIPLYLAMTAAEMAQTAPLPPKIAWMACHFSPYGTGLSNLPKALPEDAMIIVNDRTPVSGHDPEQIVRQLSQLIESQRCKAVLLDFQRPNEPETAKIAKAIVAALPCPTAVTEYYASDLKCPVFLPPVPPHTPMAEHIAPWQDREIWLELALDGTEITVTPQGSKRAPLYAPGSPENSHRDPQLHCHYDISAESLRICFRLYRTPEDLSDLLNDAERIGVTHAVGLYQELRNTVPEI